MLASMPERQTAGEVTAAAALGLAAGLLLGPRFTASGRSALAVMLAVGAGLAFGPALARTLQQQRYEPNTTVGSTRRLKLIRDSALPEEAGIYDER